MIDKIEPTSLPYFKAEVARPNPKVIITNKQEIEVKDTKFGEKLHVPVKCGDKDYMWTCNNTTRTFLVDNLGKDETKWVGKTIEIEIVKTQTSNGLMDAMYPKGAL
jgi:hypothetical protein